MSAWRPRSVSLLSACCVTFVVAIGVRLLHLWQMRGTPFFSVLMGDSRGYDAWAQRLASGEWIGTDVFYQAPLYPYFLAVVYSLVGHDLLAVRVVQALVGAAGAVALVVATTRLFSPGAGLLAGLMLALYPPAIFFDALIQKSVLDVCLMAVSLAIIATLMRDGNSRGRWLALGVTMGALVLTRENAGALAAVLLIWGFARGPRPVAAFVLGVALVVLPVAARNYAVSGGLYLTTSQFGSNFYIGNNPNADGSYMSLREGRGSPEYERVDATELAEAATGRPLTPGEVSAYWTARTLDYIRRAPGDWLALLARKAWMLLNTTEVIDTESQESHAEHSWPLRVLSTVWEFGVLMPLAVLGLVVTWPRRRELRLWHALTLVYASSVVAFYVVARYRLPLVPLLIPFAAAGVLGVRQVRAGAIAAFVIALTVSNWPLYSAGSQQAITENNLGAALQEAGRIQDAIDHYRRALTFDPGYAPAMNNLGTALRATGRADEAIATYDAAIAAGAGANASLHLNRGNALMQQGRASEAISAFRHALAAEPDSADVRRALANALYDAGVSALEAGAPGAAEASFREAIALRRDYAEAHNNLGIALASQGRLAEAVTAWQDALAVRPDFDDARRNLELARQH